MNLLRSATVAVLSSLVAASLAFGEESGDYNPLTVSRPENVAPTDLTVKDEKRNREIPIRVYLPPQAEAAPVVLFSHGLGGSREGCTYLGQHWSGRGYVAVFLQHPGSDDAVWKDVPRLERMAAMREAASGANFRLRVQDVPAVLDQLEVWNRQDDHPLKGRMNLEKVGMSGHSFGAKTTQAVSGESYPIIGQRFTDQRIDAAVIFSPSSPARGNLDNMYGSVSIPWLLMTGTKDTSVINDTTVEARTAVYKHLPESIDAYEVVFHNGEHSAFTDRALPGDTQPRNPNHHRVIKALSTATWDAYLRDDSAAQAWLQGPGPKAMLEEQDRWQLK